ncbi:MAG: cytochrome P450 [Solirubrobacteraceae bacterium]|nr:cytochrome P450 [Solirubrobacteraceae bacterium]
MGLDDAIRTALDRLSGDKDRLQVGLADVFGRVADSSALKTFALMRRHRPIVSAGSTTIVTRNEDVKEVLGDPARFTVDLYGPKMVAITGPFILGVDDTPLYRHDHAAMDRAVLREDLPMIGDRMYELARALVAERRDDDGEIDVVSQLADPAVDRTIGEYFGTPGPDRATHLRWARNVFQELFINVGNLAPVRERALADAARWRPHLDRQIAVRKAQLKAGEDVPDDVLTRLLRLQSEDEPNFHDIAIRHNILGNITGWIPTISNAFARVVEELLGRDDELERAQQAARAGDRELVGRYAFEASRFRPQNFALLRYVPQDTTIAAGSDRETTVKAGSTVFAATLSAMHDERAIEAPGEFRVDRPWSDYMLFGHGLHTCYGEHIVRAQLPALATALLEGPRLQRAQGDPGKLRFAGPYPSGLTVRFGA